MCGGEGEVSVFSFFSSSSFFSRQRGGANLLLLSPIKREERDRVASRSVEARSRCHAGKESWRSETKRRTTRDRNKHPRSGRKTELIFSKKPSTHLAHVHLARQRRGAGVVPVRVVGGELLVRSRLDDVDPGRELDLLWRRSKRGGGGARKEEGE